MNEFHFAYKVRQHLNRGLYELHPEIVNRLATARKSALNHQKQAVSQSVLAMAGSFVQTQFDNLRYKQTLTALALLVSVIFSAFWMADKRVEELSVIDSALLTDELPISAFTDKGFSAWLRQASPE